MPTSFPIENKTMIFNKTNTFIEQYEMDFLFKFKPTTEKYIWIKSFIGKMHSIKKKSLTACENESINAIEWGGDGYWEYFVHFQIKFKF